MRGCTPAQVGAAEPVTRDSPVLAQAAGFGEVSHLLIQRQPPLVHLKVTMHSKLGMGIERGR